LPKTLLPIFLIVVVDVLAMAIIFPLLPFYAEHLGATPTQVGMLVSTFAVCQLVGGPMLGRLSDVTGRKPLLILSQIGTLIGFAILAYGRTLPLIFLSRAIDGFTAGNISLAQAYIADVTEPEERTRSFAVIGIAFGIGFLIGPAMGGFLSQFSYEAPILAAMVLSAISIFTTWWLLPGIQPSNDGPRRFTILDWGTYAGYFRRPSLGSLLWQFFAFVFSFSTFMAGFALFAERRFVWDGRPFGPREVGYVYAYVGVLGIILQGGLIGRFVRWFGDWKLVRYGFLYGTIGFAALGWTSSVGPLLVAAAIIAFATGVLRPALTSLITQQAGKHEQGGVLGLTQSLQSIASIVAPMCAGLLIDHGQLAGWALLAAAATGLGLFGRKPVPVPDPAEVRTGT
jgi:MFS transporter, DHA1 family, tetracycline resistance protein